MLLDKYKINSLPFLASIYSKVYGIDIVMQGSQAMTNGNQVVIPAVDLGKTSYATALNKWVEKGHDPVEVAMTTFRALLGHECAGHVRHTDFKALEKHHITKLVKVFENVIEDPRVDYLAGIDWPGCKIDFRQFDELMYSEGPGELPEHVDPMGLLHGYMFSTLVLNKLGHETLKSFVEAYQPRMAEVFSPEFLFELDAILERALWARDTEDSISLAKEIVALLEKEKENQKQSSDSQSDTSSGNSSSDPESSKEEEKNDAQVEDSSTNQSDSESDDAGTEGQEQSNSQSSEEKSDDHASEAGQGESSDREASDQENNETDANSDSSEEGEEEQDQGGQSDTNASDGDSEDSDEKNGADAQSGEGDETAPTDMSQDFNTSTEATDGDSGEDLSLNAFELVLDPSNWEESPKSRGEMIKELFEQLANECPLDDARDVLAKQVEYPENLIENLDENEVVAESSYMAGHILSLLQSKERRYVQFTRRGRKIDPRRVHRLAVKDTCIFVREHEVKGVNTAIHMMVDNSGSMKEHELKLAMNSALAMGMALSSNKRFNLALTAFPGWSSMDCSTLIRHGEPFTNMIGIKPKGRTPLGQAIWQILPDLLECDEERKILFIITDGGPSSKTAAIQAVQDARDNDVEAYALGVGVPEHSLGTLRELFGDNFRCISSINELGDAVFDMLEDVLL